MPCTDDRAVSIGINNYKDVGDLRGCVNDRDTMVALLTGPLGFPAANVRTLVDAEAEKPAVMGLLRWLAEAKPGDRRVLHFSGHGSYTPDLDRDEADGVDELSCLSSMEWGRPSTYILDDEWRRWAATVPAGVRLTLVFDHCHSGTGTRELARPQKIASDRAVKGSPRVIVGATVAQAGKPDKSFRDKGLVLARFAPPPPEVEARAFKARSRTRSRSAASAPAGSPLGSRPGHVLLAGCRADQTAADAWIDGQFCGAFTHHLAKIAVVKRAVSNPAELTSRLGRAMRDGGFEQVPQVEGEWGEGGVFGS